MKGVGPHYQQPPPCSLHGPRPGRTQEMAAQAGDPIDRAMFAQARDSDGMLAIMQRDLMSHPTPLLLLLQPLLLRHTEKPPVRPARIAIPGQGHDSCFLCLSMLSF